MTKPKKAPETSAIAETGVDPDVAEAATGKTSTKKTAAKKAAAKKSATKKAAKTTGKTTAKKATKKAAAKTATKAAKKVTSRQITAAERHARIAEAAYLRAESLGFRSDAHSDWVHAEAEVDARLRKSRIRVVD